MQRYSLGSPASCYYSPCSSFAGSPSSQTSQANVTASSTTPKSARSSPSPSDAVVVQAVFQAKALREEAEKLANSRKEALEQLEKEYQHSQHLFHSMTVNFQKRISELERDNQMLTTSMEALRNKEKLTTSSAKQWEVLATERQNALAALITQFESLSHEHETVALELQSTKNKLQSTVIEKEEGESNANATTELLKLRAERSEATVKDLQEKLRFAEITMATAKEETPKTQQQIETLTFEKEILKMEVEGARQELEETKASLASSQSELESLKKLYETEEQIAALREHNLKEVNAQLAGHRTGKQKVNFFVRLSEENEQLRKRVHELETRRPLSALNTRMNNNNTINLTTSTTTADKPEKHLPAKLTEPVSPKLRTAKRRQTAVLRA